MNSPLPDVLVLDVGPDVSSLVARFSDHPAVGDVDVASSFASARARLGSGPPALLVAPVDRPDGEWRSLAAAARGTRTDLVVVDGAGEIRPETAVDAGATGYVASLDDRSLPAVVARLVELARRPPPDTGPGLPADIGIAGLGEIDDVVYLFDADGRLRWWNRRLETVTGRPPDELDGTTPAEFFRGRDRETIEEAFARTLDGESVTVEAGLVTADGEAVPYEFTGNLLSRPDWGRRYVCGVGRDVSERVERERELRETTRRMDAIFQDPLTFVGVLDTDGRLLEANETALAYVDAAPAAVHGERFWDLPWWTHSEEARTRVEAAVETATGGESVRFETEHHRHDGHVGVFDCVVRPVTDGDGEVVTVLAEAIEVTERESLRRQLDEVLDRIDDAVFALDADWRFTYVNDRSLELTYSNRDDLLGEVFWDAFPLARDSTFEREFRRAMETQEVRSFEAYYGAVDMWTEVRAYPSETGLSVYYRDVTDERRAEQERTLLTSVTRIAAEAASFEGALEDVLETVCSQTDFVYGEAWVPTGDALTAFATHATKSLPADFVAETESIGFEREVGLPGRVWASTEPVWVRDVADGTDATFARRNHVRESLHSAVGVPVDVDEQVVAVLTFFLPYEQDADATLVDSLSTTASSIGTVLDRQRTRDELEREQSLLARIFDTSPVGVAVAGAGGDFVRANDEFARILGVSEREITARTYFAAEWEVTDAEGDPIPDADLPIGRVLATGVPVFGYEHRVVQADGTRVWVRVNAAPLFDESGDVEYAIAALQDITAERRRKRELARQREQLTVMDRILRHDIRTHANVVQGYVDLLGRGQVSVEELAATTTEHLESLLSTAEKTRRATHSDAASGATPVTVAELLDDCRDRLDRRVDEYGLDVTVDPAVERRVESTTGLVLALTELLENAVEYGGAAAPVEVDVEPAGPDTTDLRVRIVDHGPGIPDFELDVLAANRETPLAHSSGIGIWLARWLLEDHGGTLDIARTAEGGTECLCTLPTVDAA